MIIPRIINASSYNVEFELKVADYHALCCFTSPGRIKVTLVDGLFKVENESRGGLEIYIPIALGPPILRDYNGPNLPLVIRRAAAERAKNGYQEESGETEQETSKVKEGSP